MVKAINLGIATNIRLDLGVTQFRTVKSTFSRVFTALLALAHP